MRVYRVEHKETHLGPWRHYDVKGDSFYAYGNHLPPMHGRYAHKAGKAKDIPKAHLRLGMRTLSQFFRWFNDVDCQRLATMGFVLRVYSVRTIILKDEYQVLVHIPDHKKPVATFSLLEISS